MLNYDENLCSLYSVFQGFRQAKSANGSSILSSSQFLILPQLPQKMKLASKVIKVDSKIIISMPKIGETHCSMRGFPYPVEFISFELIVHGAGILLEELDYNEAENIIWT